MPIYEYLCDACAHRFEVKQSFNDPPISACERCGQAVRKLISAPGIMFKGSGWYVTDYSNKLKESKPAEGSSNGTDSKPAKDAASTESKPAPTPAPSTSSSSDSKPSTGS